MSLPQYATYKTSELEWLGEIPKHWRIKRLRFVAELNPSKSEIAGTDRETLVSFLPMEAIGNDGTLNLERAKTVGELESGYTYFRDGDVTVAKITPCYENGKGAVMRGLLNGIGFGTTELIVARPKPEHIIGTYLHYLFLSTEFRGLGESHMYGAGGQKRVPDGFVQDFKTALPSLNEQISIVAFLDRETTKIDGLVGEQRRLIELLKEKRQAVISHAVTKGLNPHAPMKPSSIEWLGDVPEHWGIERGRFLFQKLDLLPEPDDGVVTAFRDGQVTLRGNRRTDGFTLAVLEVGYQHVRAGDLVIHGMDAFAGAIGVSESTGKCTPEYSVMTPTRPGIDNRYFALILRLMAQRNFVFVICPSVRERAPRFRFESFKEVSLPVPPLEEQIAIMRLIQSISEESVSLIAEAQRAIDLLQERRTALISAAVTGKIDVRGLADPEAA